MNPLQAVEFVRHGTVCLAQHGVTIYVDPCGLDNEPQDADVVIVTHAQASRYSPEDVQRVRQDDTCFLAPAPVASALEQAFGVDDCYITFVNDETPTVYLECGVGITPVPVYKAQEPVRLQHGFGVVVHLGDCVYYFSGATDTLIPDIRCDVLFLQCDGFAALPQWEQTVTNAVQEMDTAPSAVVPYSGSDDGEAFALQVRAALEAAGVTCAEG